MSDQKKQQPETREPEVSDMDGWCVECGDEFHLDDCGGYNPPCEKCGLCRFCCECEGWHHSEDEGFDD